MATPDQEVIEAIENKAGFTGDAIAAAKVLSDAAEALVKKHGGSDIHMSVKIFRGGVFEAVNLPLNIAQGDVTEKAVAKALVGILSGVAVGAAAAAITTGAPFIVAFGTAVAFGYYAGSAINEAVSGMYDIVVGPDFTIYDDEKRIDVDYALSDAITASEGWINKGSFKSIILEKGWSDEWILKSTHITQGGEIRYKDNTYTFVGQSLSSLRKDGSYMDLIAMKMHAFGDFNIISTDGKYLVINLLNKTASKIESLATSDSSVMYALERMKTYAIQGDVDNAPYSDMYIKDKAQMLYWHSWAKTHPLGKDFVDRELSRYDTYYYDIASDLKYGEGNFNLNYEHYRVFGTKGNDTFVSEEGNDHIYGNAGNDKLYGRDGNDYLEGGNGSDELHGGAGQDILIGAAKEGVDDGASDHLEGGKGFDTYIAGNGDTIKDSDGEGLVKFDGIDLTGKKYKNSESGQYEDDDYIYEGDPEGTGSLVVTSKNGSKSITIQEWSNEDLGIELLDNKDIEVSITESATASEGDSGKRYLSFTVTLSRALEDGEALDALMAYDKNENVFTQPKAAA